MKLAERLARRPAKGRAFHSAIVTTFAIEFVGFEEVMLPQLGVSGASNVLVLADERMSAIALSDGSILPQQLGRDYALHGPSQSAGVFHPKVILQLGGDGGRAFVGSGNATAAGIGGNLEIFTEISCTSAPSPERDFVRAIWRYLEQVSEGAEGAASDSVRWARERTPWLAGPEPVGVQTLEDGALVALLGRPGPSGIADRLVELVADKAERLIVLSPYWDQDLQALIGLAERLGHPSITVLLDPLSHDFPIAVAQQRGLHVVDISNWQGGARRFKHAKVIIVQTGAHDHVIAGSANCTVAALGKQGFAGTNAEACVYQRVPTGQIIESLGLSDLIAEPSLDFSKVVPLVRREPIELAAAQDLRPGTFEAEHGELRWSPPLRPWSGHLVLLDADAEEVGRIAITALGRRGDIFTSRVDEADVLHFVQVDDGEIRSMIGPVIHRGMLRSRRREAASRSVANAAEQFANRGDLQLFLVQALDELQRADLEEQPERAQRHSRGEIHGELKPEDAPKVLSYEEFVQQQPAARRTSGGESSISGTHTECVRTLLNRLSGAQPGRRNEGGGGGGGGENPAGGDGDQDEEVVVLPPADRSAFVKAIKAYETSMSGGEGARAVDGTDVLRLRFWLLLLLHSARRPDYFGGLPPTAEDFGWPRLAVRILSAFFYQRELPIARLVVAGDYLDVPVDFLETWATAVWVLDLVPDALGRCTGRAEFLKRLPLLRVRMIQRMGLSPAELDGEAMARVRTGLDQEFGHRFRSITISG